MGESLARTPELCTKNCAPFLKLTSSNVRAFIHRNSVRKWALMPYVIRGLGPRRFRICNCCRNARFSNMRQLRGRKQTQIRLKGGVKGRALYLCMIASAARSTRTEFWRSTGATIAVGYGRRLRQTFSALSRRSSGSATRLAKQREGTVCLHGWSVS